MGKIYKNKTSLVFQDNYIDFKTGRVISPIETQNYKVLQVAESYYIGGFKINSYRQFCDLEITVAITGGLICSTDGIEERVEKNGAYLSFAGDSHGLFSSHSCRFQTLAVNAAEGSTASGLIRDMRERCDSTRSIPASDATPLLSDIVSEMLNKDQPYFKNHLDALITSLLVRILRRGERQTNAQLISYDSILIDIINYLDCHFLEICALDELSKFGYSYNYICKIFKDNYHLTPREYLSSKRMDHAAELLSAGASISTVSEKLGYSSPYNFSRAFKKHFGFAPSHKNRFL